MKKIILSLIVLCNFVAMSAQKEQEQFLKVERYSTTPLFARLFKLDNEKTKRYYAKVYIDKEKDKPFLDYINFLMVRLVSMFNQQESVRIESEPLKVFYLKERDKARMDKEIEDLQQQYTQFVRQHGQNLIAGAAISILDKNNTPLFASVKKGDKPKTMSDAEFGHEVYKSMQSVKYAAYLVLDGCRIKISDDVNDTK